MIAKHHGPGTVSPRREFHKHFRTQGRGLNNADARVENDVKESRAGDTRPCDSNVEAALLTLATSRPFVRIASGRSKPASSVAHVGRYAGARNVYRYELLLQNIGSQKKRMGVKRVKGARSGFES